MPVFWGIAQKLANSLPNGLRYRLFDSLHCEKSNKLLELLPNTQHNGSFPPDTTLNIFELPITKRGLMIP